MPDAAPTPAAPVAAPTTLLTAPPSTPAPNSATPKTPTQPSSPADKPASSTPAPSQEKPAPQQPPTPGEKPATETDKPAAEAAAPVEVEVQLPEGVSADKPTLDAFKAIAKTHGLKGEAAQELVNLYAKAQSEASARYEAAVQQQRQTWKAAVDAHPEIGGARLQESLVHAQRAVTFAGGDALREVLNETGLGNHPAFVAAFVKLGKALGEDSIAATTQPGPGQQSEEAVLRKMFPTMYPQE